MRCFKGKQFKIDIILVAVGYCCRFSLSYRDVSEQDHRHVKQRFAKSVGFQSLRHASWALKGIETVHALYKRSRILNPDFGFSTYDELQKLFTIA
ncbi:IS6 family transposase (plasmid) [Bacillus mycoides]|nr:IS6 family transposase [Bacillus mycoides]